MKIICWRFHIKTPFTFWDMRTWDVRKICLQTFRYNCRFSYARTWELVNLFVGTKNFSYHICYENIGREHNIGKYLLKRQRESKKEFIKWNEQRRNIHSGFQGLKKDQKESCFKTLDDLQNLLIKWSGKASAEKAWLLYEFPFL